MVPFAALLHSPSPALAQTAAITAPGPACAVSGTITVSADASGVGVLGVQFRLDGAALGAEDTSAPYSVMWDTRTAAAGSHTLTAVARGAAGLGPPSPPVLVTVTPNAGAGDVFVGFLDGRVQWHAPSGTLLRTLTGGSDGEASGLTFDVAGNLYVPHWINAVNPSTPGNLVTRFDPDGNYMGTFGSGYDCNPSSFAFDASGDVYVGQADCTADILKLDASGNVLVSFDALTALPPGTGRGADHIDLASDGCTMFYSNWTKDILRYNVCTGTQLAIFNTAPLPGSVAFHIRLLPDGGVLVADSEFIVRLSSIGNVVWTISRPGSNYWTGLDIARDGTFLANNYSTSDISRFTIETGAFVFNFNAAPGATETVVGVAVKP